MHETGTAINTLVKIVTMLAARDPQFMERFAKRTAGRTRRLVSRDRAKLYDNSLLIDYSKRLENGWWLGTNLASRDIRKHTTTACDEAGVKFGIQLKLIER